MLRRSNPSWRGCRSAVTAEQRQTSRHASSSGSSKQGDRSQAAPAGQSAKRAASILARHDRATTARTRRRPASPDRRNRGGTTCHRSCPIARSYVASVSTDHSRGIEPRRLPRPDRARPRPGCAEVATSTRPGHGSGIELRSRRCPGGAWPARSDAPRDRPSRSAPHCRTVVAAPGMQWRRVACPRQAVAEACL